MHTHSLPVNLGKKLAFIAIGIILSQQVMAVPSPVRPIYPAAPTMSSNSYMVMDYDSGQVLAGKNVDESIPPASVTKMMTMYVIDNEIKSGHLSLEDEVTISRNAWQAEGSRMFVEVGSKVKVKDLVRGIIIQSGNDASIALAEHIAGSERAFTEIMNSYAQLLGMTNSHFANPTGLPDPENHVTAKDLSKLGQAVIRDFPETYKIYSEKVYTYNNIKQFNRNLLLWCNDAVDGIKTGRTDQAGYCLVSSAKKNGMRLVAVVMGSKSADINKVESNKLLTWGFRFFKTHKLYTAGESLQNTRVWLGKTQQLNVGLEQDLFVTIPQGHQKKLSAQIDLPATLKAPIKLGQQLGVYKVKLQEEVLVEVPVVALNAIEAGNLWHRIKDSISLNMQALWDKVSASVF